MNALLKNLIAKLSNKDFPGYGEGDGYARKELAKKRSPAQEPTAQRAEKSLNDIKSDLDALLNEPAQALNDADKRSLARSGAPPGRAQRAHRRAARETGIAVSAFPPARSQRSFKASAKPAMRWATRITASASWIPAARCRRSARALDRLSQSQQQMQSAMQQMAQRGQLGNMPMTRLFRQGGRFHARWVR